MQKTMRQGMAAILAILLISLTMVVPKSWADVDNSATIDLADAGDGKVSVAMTTDVEGITTLSLALDITVSSGGGDALTVNYLPSQKVKDSTTTHYDTTSVDGDVVRMNIYVVDGTDLFTDGRLDIGTLSMAITEGSGVDSASATVSVPMGVDAVRAVSGYDEEVRIPDANIYVPDEPTVTLGAQTPNPEVDEEALPRSSVDVVGDTPETTPDSANGAVPFVGDNLMPVIIVLICIIVVAAIVVAVVFARRKKDDPKE